MKKLMHCFVLSAMVALSAAACGGGGGGDDSGGSDSPGTPGQTPGGGDPGASGGGPYWVEGTLNDTSEGSADGLVTTGFPEYKIGPVTWAERDHLYIMPSGSGLAHVKAVADTLPGNFTRFDGEDCYMPVDMNLEPFFSRNIRHAEICFDMERGVALLETEIEASGDVTEEMMNAVFGDITGKSAYPLGAIQIDRKTPAGADIGAYVVELKSRGFQERYDDGEPEYWKIGADGNTYLFEYDIEGAYVDAEWVVYR
jgi:hypothetical protein